MTIESTDGAEKTFIVGAKAPAEYIDNATYGTGTPRILNGAIDIGAVEYDWRPKFSEELGRRFAVEYASPLVVTNVTGGVLMQDGEISGMVTSAEPYAITFEMSGGSLAVYVGDALAGECSGTGEQSMLFSVPDAAQVVRIVFTPDGENPGCAILKRFYCSRGISICIR